jgi:alanine racemase
MGNLVWIELDAEAFEHNLRELRRSAASGVLFCAVVKSNAYGHGVSRMVKLLPSADWLAVNSLEEGRELRGLGIKKPVLVLGHVPLNRLHEALEADLRLTVYNRETVNELKWMAMRDNPARVHLKVETGTGRQGVLPGDLPDFLRLIQSAGGVVLEGVSTHFANIEDTLNHEYSERQLHVFQKALDTIERMDVHPPIVHAACTAAGILFPATHFTMLREGIGVYGLWPSRETYLSARMACSALPDLRPVLTWKTRVVQVKIFPEGSYVGYGCTYRTTRRTRVAVLPVGYADGYDRALGNTAYVLINEKRAPVIGRVCMNLTMADVTDIPDVKLENEVVLLGRWGREVITAETLASWAGTINYEIVTRISPLLERRVVHAGTGGEQA